jgi:hypothetical protein
LLGPLGKSNEPCLELGWRNARRGNGEASERGVVEGEHS